ncbi:hypothetical protein M426DRAFT_27969 [Hypoxylon sp. CI-4A]|nr:hypothetical protein M426DRAFT_27969 [Hypoxylon sp. CI-4A]
MPRPLDKNIVSRLQCSTCSNTYSSNSHLRRHEATHNSNRLIICPSCSKSFARMVARQLKNSDVARRHLQSCVKDDTNITLPTAKRGKRPRACDQCSRSKVACDLNTPCSRCQSRGVPCSYLRDKPVNSNEVPVIKEDHWFLRVTDPQAAGITDAISQDINTDSVSEGGVMSVSLGTFEDELLPLGPRAWLTNFTSDFALDIHEEYTVDANDLIAQSPALSARMEELIAELANTHEKMRINGTTGDASFDVQLAQSIFTPWNLDYFIRICFQCVLHHYPVMHPHTFSYENTSLPLLLAAFLFGALFSAPVDDAISAHSFFRVAEEYIFDRLDIEHLQTQAIKSGDAINFDSIEIIQAAFSILIIQNSKNDETIRRRVRIQRHPHLIAAARLAGVFRAMHQLKLSEYSASTWDQFIRYETMVRLSHWMQLNNGFLMSCFNTQSQVHISEMVGDLPCRRELFEAETKEEFERQVSLEPREIKFQSLAAAVPFILQDSWPGPEHEVYEHVSAERLAAIINGLAMSMMTARTHGHFSVVCKPFLRACKRWRLLWDKLQGKDGCNQNAPPGFAKHSMDMCLFCVVLIRAEELGDTTSHYRTHFELDSFTSVNQFLRRYKDVMLQPS